MSTELVVKATAAATGTSFIYKTVEEKRERESENLYGKVVM